MRKETKEQRKASLEQRRALWRYVGLEEERDKRTENVSLEQQRALWRCVGMEEERDKRTQKCIAGAATCAVEVCWSE
jgi:hypothetical protein